MADESDYKKNGRVKLSEPLKRTVEKAKQTRLKVGLVAILLFFVSLGIFFAVIFSEENENSALVSVNLSISQQGVQASDIDPSAQDFQGKAPYDTRDSSTVATDTTVSTVILNSPQDSSLTSLFENIIVIATDTAVLNNDRVSQKSSPASDVALPDLSAPSSQHVSSDNSDSPVGPSSNKNLDTVNDKSPTINQIDTNKYLFVSAFGVSLYDSPGGKALDTLKYASYVEKVDETTYNNEKFTKVCYRTANGKIEGWVRSAFLSDSLKPIAGSGYENISFEPVKKTVGRVSDVRAIYLTRTSVNTRTKINNWISFAKETNLNAFVIDVKDDDGFMLFKAEASQRVVPKANEMAFYSKEEMKSIISEVKAAGIYVIARIVCFKDPSYARAHMDKAVVYKDTGNPYTGIYKVPWASAYDKQLWEYNVAISKETVEVGFDEIQYDYVRFPELTNSDMSRVDLRKTSDDSFAEAIQKFLIYAKKELDRYGIPLAADVFGLVSTAVDDLGIGQYWEAISNVVDYICPMVYPSHYANGSFGLSIPDQFPYETVYRSVSDALKRNYNIPTPARIRPWIQFFTATWVKGHITYDENAIKKEIKALKELGINEYMLWNASNNYIQMWYD